MKKYLIPVALGFAAMFLTHFLLLLIFAGLKLNFMPYIIAYPMVYVVLAYLVTKNNPIAWMSNAFFILLIPLTYWYLLLWHDNKFTLKHAIKLGESSGMLLILPITFLLVILVSYYVSRRQGQIKTVI